MSAPRKGPQWAQDALTGMGAGGFLPLTDSARQIGTQTVTYSCHGCDNRWPGVSRCHCGSCHRTFNAVGPFDTHRRERRGEGYCVDPETIVHTKTGERLMFETNGIWSSSENPAPRGQHLRKAKTNGR